MRQPQGNGVGCGLSSSGSRAGILSRSVAAVTRGQARFGDHGLEADLCLVAPDKNAEEAIVEALTRKAGLQRAIMP
jgi:hypothetical protein